MRDFFFFKKPSFSSLNYKKIGLDVFYFWSLGAVCVNLFMT